MSATSAHSSTKPSRSPLQSIVKCVNDNTKTLLTMQNLAAHNQLHQSKSLSHDGTGVKNDVSTMPKNLVESMSQHEDAKVAEYLPEDTVPSVVPADSRLNGTLVDALPIPKPLEVNFPSLAQNLPLSFIQDVVEHSSPTQTIFVNNIETKQETPVATMCFEHQSAHQHLPLEVSQNHSPVVVSMAPVTPGEITHDSAAVTAAPSMTVLGSVHRAPLSTSDHRAQLHEYLKQQTTPSNQETFSIKSRKSQVSGSARRTLAQVKERLQRWQTSDSPATATVSTPSTVDIEGISNCSSVQTSSGNVARRLPLETPDASSGSIVPSSVGSNAVSTTDTSEIVASPAICLMEDFEENSSRLKEIFGLNDTEKFISTSELSQNKLAEQKMPSEKNVSDSQQKLDDSKPKASFTRLVLLFVSIMAALTVGTLAFGIFSHTFSGLKKPNTASELHTTEISKPLIKNKVTLRLSPNPSLNLRPTELAATEDGTSSFIHLNEELPFSIYTQLMLQSSRTSKESQDICLNWMSFSHSVQTVHKTKPASANQNTMKKKKLWSRMKNWFQTFSSRLRNRFTWGIRSRSPFKSLPPVTSNIAVQSLLSSIHEQRVEGILRAGDCTSFSNSMRRKRENSWWRVRSVAADVPIDVAAQFQLQYLGEVSLASAVTETNIDWCLSVHSSFSTTELRPCSMQPMALWQLDSNHLSVVSSSTADMETRRKLRWHWDAHFRTQAVSVQMPETTVQEQDALLVTMLTWLPTITTTNNHEFHYQSQRIDSIT